MVPFDGTLRSLREIAEEMKPISDLNGLRGRHTAPRLLSVDRETSAAGYPLSRAESKNRGDGGGWPSLIQAGGRLVP